MSSDKKKLNTGFYDIFKGKLERHKKDIKEELQKAKSDRRKDWLKSQLKQTKSLQKTVHEMEEQMDMKKTHCPHCGERL
jgi:hypothetical protein